VTKLDFPKLPYGFAESSPATAAAWQNAAVTNVDRRQPRQPAASCPAIAAPPLV
jgi:hypothetical protein